MLDDERHSVIAALQGAWRHRVLKKKMAVRMLLQDDVRSLLVCQRYLTGAEDDARIRPALERLGQQLYEKDKTMTDELQACMDHEECMLSYNILAARFGLSSVDELYVLNCFEPDDSLMDDMA